MILDLAEEARQWLRGKDTDQWAVPWGGTGGPQRRVAKDIAAEHVWLLWDGGVSVATITIDTAQPVDDAGNSIWPAQRLNESALYVHRVIVRRSYAGQDLGGALLDWASEIAARTVETQLIRIDVWTDNLALHDYYLRQGFEFAELRSEDDLPGYPCRALFERRSSPLPRNPSLLSEQ
jgi:GNAT superfamily N-acetyltransferase